MDFTREDVMICFNTTLLLYFQLLENYFQLEYTKKTYKKHPLCNNQIVDLV